MGITEFGLHGKVAIVTGGKSGIGKAIALALAGAGADVAVCGRVLEDGQLRAVADEVQRLGRRSLAVRTDISRKADVDNLVKTVVNEFGGIDILVNNAGNYFMAPLVETPEDDWDRIINTHLKGYYFCCQAAGKIMAARKRGNIINIASAVTHKVTPRAGVYCIAKGSVIMLTRVLAVELAPYNIRVNAISPGLVKTKLLEAWFSDEAYKRIEPQVPLGRMAQPDDMTGAAIFLASDASSFITGQTIVVDGGRYL
jgi:NAD(P)-dependent dehydrogenase (short-subunit alcohol dehydrogenase family)